MKVCRSPRPILALAMLAVSLTVVLHAATITIAPANPTIIVGQTQQLTANGAIVPGQIASGLWHSCVLYSDQSVGGTGLDNRGEIGGGTVTGRLEPVLGVAVNAVSLRNGNEHTCTLVGDGRMQCWGTNFTGQLGDGTFGGFSSTPIFVHNITNAIKSIPGGYHTCAMM